MTLHSVISEESWHQGAVVGNNADGEFLRPGEGPRVLTGLCHGG